MKWLAILLIVFASLPARANPLADLQNLDPLKQQFNSDVGKARLISILSPT
ncbi:MAG TPA: hypothetical protein VJ521_06765 [Acidobacteriota bacterium]|nr:hypothetical protein [Acidobacteriota bacterium]